MATTPNGRHNGYIPHATHRLDERADQALRAPSPAGPIDPDGDGDGDGGGRSGRRFVLGAIFVLAAVWLALFLFFSAWRARYYARAAFGAAQVAPVVGEFKKLEPPGVPRDDWLDAVDRTRSLVQALTATNLLSIDQMKALRAELSQRLARARARPDAALDELATVWDSISARASFLLREARADDGARHVRPSIFPSPPPPKRPERSEVRPPRGGPPADGWAAELQAETGGRPWGDRGSVDRLSLNESAPTSTFSSSTRRSRHEWMRGAGSL